MLRPGDRVGRYQCIRALRQGGMAQLFVARAVDDARELVVIKRILPALGTDEDLLRMFEKEARIGRTLDHPNIARVIQAGEIGLTPYMVVEYVRGVDLRRLLKHAVKEAGALPLGVAIGIAVRVADALHYAHERAGIVHRDVDPSNVLVAVDGTVKLVDFGIARTMAVTRTTRASWIKGKAGYMSPEQCLGGHIDRRTDVFALGILLYEMTTGYRLFHGATDYETTNLILTGDYVKPSEAVGDYPEGLEAIVVRALQTDPDLRFPTAEAFGTALVEFARDENVALQAAARADAVRPFVDAARDRTHAPPKMARSRGLLLGAALGVPVAILGVVLLRPDAEPSPSPRDVATKRAADAATVLQPQRTGDAAEKRGGAGPEPDSVREEIERAGTRPTKTLPPPELAEPPPESSVDARERPGASAPARRGRPRAVRAGSDAQPEPRVESKPEAADPAAEPDLEVPDADALPEIPMMPVEEDDGPSIRPPSARADDSLLPPSRRRRRDPK